MNINNLIIHYNKKNNININNLIILNINKNIL